MKTTLGNPSETKLALNLVPLELELAIHGARHFSLWLIPSQHDYDLLAKIIKDLADQYNAPVFEPHVTIYAGVYTRQDRLEEIVARFVEMVEPVSLIVQGIGFSDDFFKTLFVEFEDNPVLTTLSHGVRSELQYQERYDLRPHLSLMYKNLSEKRKRAIIDRLNFVKPQIYFDKVTVVSPGNPSQGWADVGSWEVSFRRRLASSV